MSYLITKGCERKDSFCIEACPFDCIELKATSPNHELRLSLDTDLCTNCGACALVCPENVFAPASAGVTVKGLSIMPTVKGHGENTPKQRKPSETVIPAHAVIASQAVVEHVQRVS